MPKADVERYNAALLEGGSLPTDWASELEKSIEHSSPFTTRDQLETMKDIALAKELGRMLEAVPEIDHARVLWTPAHKKRWPHGSSRVTATVYLQPRRGSEISMQLVQSARAAVASAVPELSPNDVVVFDQSTAKSYLPEHDGDPYDSRQLQRINELTEMYKKKIADSLNYIEDVLITVNVEVDDLKSHVQREQLIDPKKTVSLQQIDRTRTSESSQQAPRVEPGMKANQQRDLQIASANQQTQKDQETNSALVNAPSFTVTEKEFAAAMPKTVQVAVQIPETYFQKALAQPADAANSTQPAASGSAAGGKTKETIIADVKAAVTRAVGGSAASDLITVSSYLPVDTQVPEVAEPWTGKLTSAASRWGGAVGLALFALWALRMLQKTTPKVTPPAEQDVAAPTLAIQTPADDEEEPLAPKPKEVSKRDLLQNAVRDNPEVAASVLGKWIQSNKG